MSVGIKKKLGKYVEYVLTKIQLMKEQKVFVHDNVSLKYIYKEHKDADTLAVVFSACTRKGLKARYNYMKTLNGMKCNRLYILDDAAKDNRGCYYLGENCTFNIEKATIKLIEEIKKSAKAKKVVFCGSSKGGYAAVNIGLQFKNAHIVAGAPQYFLASYLNEHKNLDTISYIMGEYSEEKFNKIEFYLRERILNNKNIENQKIELHYSDKEHTYEEHIVHMLKDMNDMKYNIKEDIKDYENHSDISYYFPDFLREKISEVIEDVKDI